MIKYEDVKLISEIIDSGLYQNYKSDILSLFKKQNYVNYFVKKMGFKCKDLKEIDFILDELLKQDNFYNGPYIVFEILDNSIEKENVDFILNYIGKKYEHFKQEKQTKEESLDLVIQLLEKAFKVVPEKVDIVFGLLEKITSKSLDKSKKELREYRSNRDYEKQLITELLKKISDIYLKDKRSDRIKKLIRYISVNFNLVDDDSHMEMYTSKKIFEILKRYILLNFEDNFEEIIDLIVKQYKVVWGEDFDGWEFSGGGISQSGNYFSVSDRYFNEYTFIPAILEYYEKLNSQEEKDNFWEKEVKRICYTKNPKDISARRPEFLNRAIIPLLFKRYSKCSGINKAEAFDILGDFIKARKGIPHKAELIYQYIYKNIDDFTNDELWIFVQIVFGAEWNKKRIAPNVFVEKIISKLADNKHEEAIAWLEESIKDPEMTVDKYWEGGVIETVKKIINSTEIEDQQKGIQMFIDYISAEKFYNELGRFETFSVAEALASIFDIDYGKGLEVVQGVNKNSNLTMNQQILITSGINRIDKPALKEKIFNDFLVPVFFEMGGVDDIIKITGEVAKTISRKMEKRFDHNYARVAIAELGKTLAENKRFKEAMVIARIFINDTDPRIDDKEYNYHQKIIDGQESGSTISISTVRGWVCWLLSNIPVLEGREYVEEVVNMVDKLSKDENFYIRYMATFPLSQLVRVRHTVVKSGTTDRFISIKFADRIENIAFEMLRKKENRDLKAVMSGIVRVFNFIRNLDTKRAIEVLNYFKDFEDEDSLPSIVSLFIFYVEYRKESFKGELWSDRYFDYLKDFDNTEIKRIHDELLQGGNDRIRSAFALKYATLMEEGKTPEEKEKCYTIAIANLKKLVKNYSPNVFDDIYRFVESNIENKYSECLSLFKDAIAIEKKIMEDLQEGHNDRQYAWRGFYNFDRIFGVVFKNSEKDYLDCFELIMKIKMDNFVLSHVKTISQYLLRIKGENDRIDTIFNFLIENVSPDFYDMKVEWDKNH